MKCRTGTFFFLLIFFLVSVPRIMKAQGSREGNHCAVVRSPYRLSMDSGKMVYSKQCLSCHQADGLGTLVDNPSLHGKGVTGDKEKLIEILIRVHPPGEGINGKSSEDSVRPNPTVNDQEIADVLTYIRNSFGNKASMVKVEEVKTERGKMKIYK